MILEQRSKEQAELYALRLLDPTEAADFENQLRHDEDLQQFLNEMQDTVAAVALTAPRQTPPASALDALRTRVLAPTPQTATPTEGATTPATTPTTTTGPRIRAFRPAWAAAAAIVLLAGFAAFQSIEKRSNQREIADLKATLEGDGSAQRGGSDSENRQGIGAAHSKGTARRSPNGLSGLPRKNSAGHQSYVLKQNLGDLKAELDRLKKIDADRFTARAGLSRMVVIEMLDPALSEDEKQERRMVLSREVSDILATGLEDEIPAAKDPLNPAPDPETAPEPEPEATGGSETPASLHLSGDDNTWDGDIVIEDGMVNLSIIDLPEDAIITHKKFPVDSWQDYRGIEALPDGQFYDRYSDILWRPHPNGDYLGARPGIDIPEQAPSQTQTLKPEPVNPPAAEPIIDAFPVAQVDPVAKPPDARAFTLFDETTGEGSIVVQDVPLPADGEAYQLWMVDPRQEQPISLGMLPPLDNGAGRIFFELPETGVSPSNYLLTTEPASGSLSPSSQTILEGP